MRPAKKEKPTESPESRRRREIQEYEDLVQKAKLQIDLEHAEAALRKARGEKTPLAQEAKVKFEQDDERFRLYRDGMSQAEKFKRSDPERYERAKAFWENWKDEMSI